MTTASPPRRPRARRLQAAAMRIANVPMRRMLSLRVATPLGRRLMLATIIGRRTGRVYRQPLSYVEHDGTLLTPGGGRWTLNLTGGQPVRVRRNGRDELLQPEIVADPGEVNRLLQIITAVNPMAGRFVGIARDADGAFDPTPLGLAVAHGFRIIRWHPADGGGSR